MILPVIGLQHHEPLVPGKHLFDLIRAPFQPQGDLPLLLLDGFRPVVQRQHQQIDRKAQYDDGKNRAFRHLHRERENHVKKQFNRSDDQLV